MAKKSKKNNDKAGEARKSRKAAVPAQRGAGTTMIADKRRANLRAAHEAAVAAAELTGLDEQLEITDSELRHLESRRERAQQHLLSLHDAIGTAQLNRARIRSERKHARSCARAAQDRAVNAERQYDRAVLAQMLDSDVGRENAPAPLV